MAKVPVEKFEEAVIKAVQLNERFVSALRIRSIIIHTSGTFGSGPQVGVKPADEYIGLLFCYSCRPYFKGDFKQRHFVIVRQYDHRHRWAWGNTK